MSPSQRKTIANAAAMLDGMALDATAIKLAINSPGGSVFDALAIYNALRQHPAAVEVTIIPEPEVAQEVKRIKRVVADLYDIVSDEA